MFNKENQLKYTSKLFHKFKIKNLPSEEVREIIRMQMDFIIYRKVRNNLDIFVDIKTYKIIMRG